VNIAFVRLISCFANAQHGTSCCNHKPGKPGMLGNFSEHGNLGELSANSVQLRGKIVTNNILCSSFKREIVNER